MIYDSLSNIDIYKGFSADIFEGLTFMKQATSDLANGVYQKILMLKQLFRNTKPRSIINMVMRHTKSILTYNVL